MDLSIEIVEPDVGRPFRALAHGGEGFPTYWHSHADYELVYGTTGELRIGDVVGQVTTPRMILLAPQLPHGWTESGRFEHLFVQFHPDWLGSGFLAAAGCERLAALLARAAAGLVVEGAAAEQLAGQLRALLPLRGLPAISGLLSLLDAFADAAPQEILVAGNAAGVAQRLRTITQWINEHAGEEIALADAAAAVDMHPQAFARYFRRASGHSFVGYLGHVRVGNACRLLRDSEQSVTAIALQVGFGTVANFNRTFLRLRRMTPSAYRQRLS